MCPEPMWTNKQKSVQSITIIQNSHMYKTLQVNLMTASGWLVKQQKKFNISKCKET